MEQEANLDQNDVGSQVPSVPPSITDDKSANANIWKDFVTTSYDIIDCNCHSHYQR